MNERILDPETMREIYVARGMTNLDALGTFATPEDAARNRAELQWNLRQARIHETEAKERKRRKIANASRRRNRGR